MKEIAVIILNWNGQGLLEKFLPSVIKFTPSEIAEIIVADNGSTDNSVEWMENSMPDVKVLAFDKNHGFAEGYNKAIAMTGYKYTLLLNSDVEVSEGWLEPLYLYMEANPDVGAVQPKILSYRNKTMFEYAGAAGGYLDKLGYPYCRGRIFDYIEKDDGQYDDAPADICWASGAAFMVRSDLYKRVGGLDSRFFAHMEEIDLCCRIHADGSRVAVVPASKVFHVGGASLAQGNPQKTYLNFRNNLLLLHKNLPPKEGRRKLFVRRLYDTLAWMMFVLKRDWKNAAAVLKAHNDFKKMRGQYTDLPETDYMSGLPGADRNIIIDYYIKRKKK